MILFIVKKFLNNKLQKCKTLKSGSNSKNEKTFMEWNNKINESIS